MPQNPVAFALKAKVKGIQLDGKTFYSKFKTINLSLVLLYKMISFLELDNKLLWQAKIKRLLRPLF